RGQCRSMRFRPLWGSAMKNSGPDFLNGQSGNSIPGPCPPRLPARLPHSEHGLETASFPTNGDLLSLVPPIHPDHLAWNIITAIIVTAITSTQITSTQISSTRISPTQISREN